MKSASKKCWDYHRNRGGKLTIGTGDGDITSYVYDDDDDFEYYVYEDEDTKEVAAANNVNAGKIAQK